MVFTNYLNTENHKRGWQGLYWMSTASHVQHTNTADICCSHIMIICLHKGWSFSRKSKDVYLTDYLPESTVTFTPADKSQNTAGDISRHNICFSLSFSQTHFQFHYWPFLNYFCGQMFQCRSQALLPYTQTPIMGFIPAWALPRVTRALLFKIFPDCGRNGLDNLVWHTAWAQTEQVCYMQWFSSIQTKPIWFQILKVEHWTNFPACIT